MLTVALCKGKLIEPTLTLFAKAGYGAVQPVADSRRLLLPCPEIGMTFLIGSGPGLGRNGSVSL